MQAKWRILRRPLETQFDNHQYVANSIARLHNFVLREQHSNNIKSLLTSVTPDEIETSVANEYDDPQFPIPPRNDLDLYKKHTFQMSTIRKAMVQRVVTAGVTRPIHSMVNMKNKK